MTCERLIASGGECPPDARAHKMARSVSSRLGGLHARAIEMTYSVSSRVARLHVAATFDCTSDSDAVRVLDRPADRDAVRDAAYAHTERLEQSRQVNRRRFAFDR